MLHTKFQDHRTSGSGEDVLRFLPFMGMVATSWSCDLDHLYKPTFPLPKEAPHKIWLGLAKWFQRRRRLNMVDDDNDAGRRSMAIS